MGVSLRLCDGILCFLNRPLASVCPAPSRMMASYSICLGYCMGLLRRITYLLIGPILDHETNGFRKNTASRLPVGENAFHNTRILPVLGGQPRQSALHWLQFFWCFDIETLL